MSAGPIGRGSVLGAGAVKAGVRRIPRTAYRTSRATISNGGNARRIIATKDGSKLRASRQRVKPTDSPNCAAELHHSMLGCVKTRRLFGDLSLAAVSRSLAFRCKFDAHVPERVDHECDVMIGAYEHDRLLNRDVVLGTHGPTSAGAVRQGICTAHRRQYRRSRT